MKKRKAVALYDELHRQNFYYCPAMTLDEIKKLIKDTYEVDTSDMTYGGNGKTFRVPHPEAGSGIFICLRDPKDLPNLIHEILHAVNYALIPRGYQND